MPPWQNLLRDWPIQNKKTLSQTLDTVYIVFIFDSIYVRIRTAICTVRYTVLTILVQPSNNCSIMIHTYTYRFICSRIYLNVFWPRISFLATRRRTTILFVKTLYQNYPVQLCTSLLIFPIMLDTHKTYILAPTPHTYPIILRRIPFTTKTSYHFLF